MGLQAKGDIMNWLIYAFEEPVDRINECYYFDSRDNELFSVFITDYWLTAEDGSVNEMPYSADEFSTLRDRLTRLAENDPAIKPIPRLSVEERKEIEWGFVQEYQQAPDEWETEISNETGRAVFNFPGRLSAEQQVNWQAWKRACIIEKIDTFCNLYGIELTKVTLWTDKKLTTMTFDVREPAENKPQTSRKRRPWWKFWNKNMFS